MWSFAFATLIIPIALPLRFGIYRLPPSKAPILRCSLRHPSSTYSFAHYAVSRLPAPFKTSDPSQQPSNLRCRFLPLLAVAVTFDSTAASFHCQLWQSTVPGLCSKHFSCGPKTAAHPSLQRPMAVPAISGLSSCRALSGLCSKLGFFFRIGLSGCRALSGLLLQAFSYGLSGYPFRLQSSVRALLKASYGSETAAWPPQKPSAPPCSVQWPFQPSVIFPAAELCPDFASSFFLRFRDCRLAPSKA